MQSLRIIFLAIVATLTAGVTIRFNIASRHRVMRDGRPSEQRDTINYSKDGIKHINAYVEKFFQWSGGEFTCKKSNHVANLYVVEATRVYNNKNEAVTANNRAKRIINQNVDMQ